MTKLFDIQEWGRRRRAGDAGGIGKRRPVRACADAAPTITLRRFAQKDLKRVRRLGRAEDIAPADAAVDDVVTRPRIFQP